MMNLQLKLFIEWCECETKVGGIPYYYPDYETDYAADISVIDSKEDLMNNFCAICEKEFRDPDWDEFTA